MLALRDMDQALDAICKEYAPTNPQEEELLLDLCPYFGVIWPSARALATFMSERKATFSKGIGIEVGCGLGLPSILASKLGATMFASDFHPDVGMWVQRNANLNQVKLQYAEWNWTQENPPEPILYHHYDFVLASDVLYEQRHPDDLARALARLVHPKGSIYLSDPGRSYLEKALKTLEGLGFHIAEFQYDVEESASRPELRLEKTRKVKVYELTSD